jgi:hypothetical protein
MIVLDIELAQESQFLFYLIPVTIGVQLSLYFVYQYFKIQDVNLKLNRILLSFGAFTFLMVCGALFLNVQRLFGGVATDIFYRVGWACALASPVGFLAFIAIEEFAAIMNLKVVKLVMGLGLIPIVVVLIWGVGPIFMGTLVFAVLSAYYIIGFQVKLIRRTLSTIRKRFLKFFIGELIALAAIPFAVMVGLGIFVSPVKEIVYFIGVALLSGGFIIIFISAFDFPPFYEFEYKAALMKFFVINRQTNICLYYGNLEEMVAQLEAPLTRREEVPQSASDILFSGGIVGIGTIIDALTDTKGESIKRIQQGDSMILLEPGGILPSLTYALVVKKEMKSITHFLQALKKVFEIVFKEVLGNLDSFKENQELLFRSFENYIIDYLKI